jgi:uncharacterized iron-regulated protein
MRPLHAAWRPLALLLALLLASLAGCALPPTPEAERIAALAPADALLLGEQHDAPAHQRLHRDVVRLLAGRGQLAAVALEMAAQGTSTAELQRTADDEAVRAALRWDEPAWPWRLYGPAVMAAVHAGVPVLGANLPRPAMRDAMANAALDGQLPGPALKAQQQAIRLGHCGLLPESQIQPMTRIQIGRDIAMAQTLVKARVPGKTVVLLAGAGHVDPTLGVPQHLPAGFDVRPVVLPGSNAPASEPCEALREQMARKAGAAASTPASSTPGSSTPAPQPPAATPAR